MADLYQELLDATDESLPFTGVIHSGESGVAIDVGALRGTVTISALPDFLLLATGDAPLLVNETFMSTFDVYERYTAADGIHFQLQASSHTETDDILTALYPGALVDFTFEELTFTFDGPHDVVEAGVTYHFTGDYLIVINGSNGFDTTVIPQDVIDAFGGVPSDAGRYLVTIGNATGQRAANWGDDWIQTVDIAYVQEAQTNPVLFDDVGTYTPVIAEDHATVELSGISYDMSTETWFYPDTSNNIQPWDAVNDGARDEDGVISRITGLLGTDAVEIGLDLADEATQNELEDLPEQLQTVTGLGKTLYQYWDKYIGAFQNAVENFGTNHEVDIATYESQTSDDFGNFQDDIAEHDSTGAAKILSLITKIGFSIRTSDGGGAQNKRDGVSIGGLNAAGPTHTFSISATFSDGMNAEHMGDGFRDTVIGTGLADLIGTDDLDDAIDGGAGNDILDGGAGLDLLVGGEGDDELYGDEGDDALFGNAGNDLMYGSAGADKMRGGIGDDIYVLGPSIDDIQENAGEGYDTVAASVSWTLGANFERLELIGTAAINGSGNELANAIFGNNAANDLNGAAGADLLIGFAGNDTYRVDNLGDATVEAVNAGSDTVIATRSWAVASNIERVLLQGTGNFNVAGNGLANDLRGNSGDNWINGSFGKDRLTGGGGRDSFIFNRALGPNNIDTITDFDVPRDVMRVDNAVFAGIGAAGALGAGKFYLGPAAHDADDRFIYNSATGRLYFDIDGTGAAAQVHFASLSTGLALTAADFIII